MFHDPLMDALTRPADSGDERRKSPRLEAVGELILEWTTGPGGTHRYRLLDRSEDGFKVHASVPMPTGTAGTIRLVLGAAADDSLPPDDPVMVAWMEPDATGGFTMGLRRLQP